MPAPLARQLWHGPLDDPGGPARELAGSIAGNINYAECLQRLEELSLHGLPLDPALEMALETWPWSIDLARLGVIEATDPDTALDELARRVQRQNRRYAALAWAAWQRGDVARARAAFDRLSAECETYDADRVARAEIAILCDQSAEPLPGPEGLRLSLLATWRANGAVALSRRLQIEAAALPAHPSLWSWLIEVAVSERDFAQAGRHLDRFAALCGADHAQVRVQAIRLALDCEDAAGGRRLLVQSLDPKAPWRWTPRQHIQHLRCLLLEAAQMTTADFRPMARHARAAHRLYPRVAALRDLWLDTRALNEDWDALAADLMSDNKPDIGTAGVLGRLGLPEAAAACLNHLPPQPPDEGARATLRAGELALRRGDLAAAQAALSTTPAAWPLRADHAYWASELALARADAQAALAILTPALARGPTRMGLILNAARAEFLAGRFAAALDHLARFRALKTAQLGTAPRDDLRDLIVHDAARARAEGRAPVDSPGLAARQFALTPASFAPVETPPIPPRIAHYWEGPRSAPVTRGLHRWAALHPQLTQTLYDPLKAARWLADHAPELSALFDRLTQPASRADLFRIAFMAREGGLFADLDEYPRAPVTPWLTGARAVFVIEEGHATIANNFLAARPGLALFQRLLARIAARLAATPAPYAWWDSGPAQLTPEVLRARQTPAETPGLRFLSQADYEARVSTNLPFPHKRSAAHWR